MWSISYGWFETVISLWKLSLLYLLYLWLWCSLLRIWKVFILLDTKIVLKNISGFLLVQTPLLYNFLEKCVLFLKYKCFIELWTKNEIKIVKRIALLMIQKFLTLIRESWKNPNRGTVTERVFRENPDTAFWHTAHSLLFCMSANWRDIMALKIKFQKSLKSYMEDDFKIFLLVIQIHLICKIIQIRSELRILDRIWIF